MARARRLCKWSNRGDIPAHLSAPGEALCATHRAAEERLRPSKAQRGYDAAHVRLRARWAPIVARGKTPCARCGELILPGQLWALDHTPDRKGYLGPSHRECNETAPKGRF